MFSSGFLHLGRIRGAPVRVHWSAPLGAIAFTGFSFSPGLWAGFLLLVLLHELGHAALVHRFGYQVVAVRIHAFGGDCQWSGDPTRTEVGVVAWGGVLAQGALWLVVTTVLFVTGMPESPVVWALAVTATSVNLRMLLFNLLPIPPLDGHLAWPVLLDLWEARKEQRAYQRDRAERQRARSREVARDKARAATKKEIDDLDAVSAEPAPMPAEVKEVLERLAREEKEKRERERGGRG